MLALWILLMSFDGGVSADWEFYETEIFGTLYKEEVIVNPTNGDILILNFDEANVQIVGANGEVKKTFGRKGKGPGEFTFPVTMDFREGKIYIQDVLTSSVSVFTSQGEFIERIRMPGREYEMVKVKGGWVYGDWGTFSEGQTTLSHADDQFKKTKVVLPIKDPGYGGGTSIWTSDGKTKAYYSPLSNWPVLRASADGSRVYLTDPNSFTIRVYDHTGKLKHTIKRDDPPIPFDTDWADEQADERRRRIMKRHPNAEFSTPSPEFFPHIRDMIVMPDGNLVVDRWRGKPDKKRYPITLDPMGKEIKNGYSWEVASRLGGFHGDHAIVLIYDEEEEMGGIARVPKSKLEAYVKANPITAENRSRNISISE